jgi:hypothetical protein
MDRKSASAPMKAVLIGLLLVAGVVRGVEVGGVEFPETWTADGQTLMLNGAGVREYGVFGIDVYAAALYLLEPMHDARAVLTHPGPKVLHMHALRSASAADTARAWAPYLRDNCQAACNYPARQARRFLSMLPDMVAGETQTYVFENDRVEMLRNGRSSGTIEGGGFARLLLSTWIGEAPTTEALKAALLGRR